MGKLSKGAMLQRYMALRSVPTCEDCTGCKGCTDCTECVDCIGCSNSIKCNNSLACIECMRCDNCTECNNCNVCSNCYSCYDCFDSENMILCVGLSHKDKDYWVLNEKVSEKKFDKALKELQGLKL